MELPKIENIELQAMDNWFSIVVDAINFDISQIETAVVALDKKLTTIDASPIAYLRDSLNSLVANVNLGFSQIQEKLNEIDRKLGV